MAMSQPGPMLESSVTQMVEADALAIGRKVLGRELTADEADSMKTIFLAAAQALAHGFIRRLAEHVVAERRDEAIEEFFEGRVKTD
jgi:ATP-dependent protease ClpP protease subunit